MHIVIATDSFKGTLTAQEVGDAISQGIQRYNSAFQVTHIPMADGGEGTVQSLVDATGGTLVTATVQDPLLRPVEATYGILSIRKPDQPSSSNSSSNINPTKTAVIEMAAASGLPLLKECELNPCITSTYGTGELILHALEKGCRSFIIGIGGSATNDGGMGMLQALGIKFLDKRGVVLPPGGASLAKLHHIDITGLDPRVLESSFLIACDVDNPLCGADGASAVYGPQKGATPEMVELLDRALSHYAEIIERELATSVRNMPGAGAAGGLGAAFLGFLGATFFKGIDLVIELTDLESHVASADLLITGEGKIDGQTKFGKTPYGVALLAQNRGIPVIALCGIVGYGAKTLLEYGFSEIHGLVTDTITPQFAMAHGAELLEELAYKVIKRYVERRET